MITFAPPTSSQKRTASPQKLRVAYILHRFPYLSETFILREMVHIREHGVDLSIFSLLAPKGGPVHREVQQLLPVTHYGSLMSWSVLMAQLPFLLLSPIKYFRSLCRVIWQTWREPRVLLRALVLFPRSVAIAGEMKAKRIQHIHANFVWLEGLAAGVVRDLVGIPFTIQPHAFGIFGRNQADVRNELTSATKIITISNYHRYYIANLCPTIEFDDVELVYCALDVEQIRPPAQRVRNRVPRILSVGRLIEKKGFEYLIDACDRLAKRGVEFQCEIVGDGPLRGALERRIAELGLAKQVHLRGAMTQDQILPLYHQCDLFALACVVARDGDRDGLPVVLGEAMACGLPVVTTPVTGIPDLVIHDKTGILVAERNAAELAEAIEALIHDEDKCRALGLAAREIVVEQCDIRRNSAQMAEIFREVAGVSSGAGMNTTHKFKQRQAEGKLV